MRMIDHALVYGKNGMPVIPLAHPFHGGCSCGRPQCSSPAKHPLNSNGVTGATTDPKQILDWWRRWPHANIGLATTKVVVLDIDLAKPGCDESVRYFRGRFGELPKTWTVMTGSGGRHLYFKPPKDEKLKNAVRLLGKTGIDFRAPGGYVVAPPSQHMQGEYRWMAGLSPRDVPLAKTPGWLVDVVRKGIRVMSRPRKDTGVDINISSFGRIADGSRNHELARICGKLIRAGKSEQESLTLLQTINAMYCDPPIGSKPGDDPREVERIHESIWKCERMNHG